MRCAAQGLKPWKPNPAKPGAKTKDLWKSADSGNFHNSAQEKALPTS
jgi:hypothetical protein